jgi:hypothetical protein
VLATLVICKVIFAAEGSATTRSTFATWFIAEEWDTLSAAQSVDGETVPPKDTFGGEALQMVATIDCAFVGSLVLVHVLAGYVYD